MSENPIHCPHCRAPIASAHASVCEYCSKSLFGAHSPHVDPAERGGTGEKDESGEASAAHAAPPKRSLAGIEQHARYAELMAYVPSTGRSLHKGMLPGIVFLLIFLSLAVYRTRLALREDESWLQPNVLMPAGFAAVSFALLLRTLRRRSALRTAALERWPARVERIFDAEPTHDGERTRPPRAEFTNDAGRSETIFLPKPLRGRVSEGELGVVYAKAGRFVDFRSFDHRSR